MQLGRGGGEERGTWGRVVFDGSDGVERRMKEEGIGVGIRCGRSWREGLGLYIWIAR